MKRGNRKYIVALFICFVTLILLQELAPKPIDWKLSYLKKDNIPFGTSALSKTLTTLFPSQIITTIDAPIYNSLKSKELDKCNYIFINQSFEPDKLDTRELLKFVEKGNRVFVAANYFSGKLADTLKIKTDDYFDIKTDVVKDSNLISNLYKPHDTARINFVNPSLKNKQDYVFQKGIANTYFVKFDTSKTIVLGKNANQKINFIEIRQGKGSIYLSTVPETFTNYHFVSLSNNDYACKALSYLPIQQTLWDEYYKVGNGKQESPLKVLFNNPALLTAYYVLLLTTILFMLIEIKRKQRIIPVIEPLRNTTLDFVEIVGTLYFQKGNHKNIADKKILYFLDYIRSTFQVRTNLFDGDFIHRIINLSGIEKNKVIDLFNLISDMSYKQEVNQAELHKLNSMIEMFYKENKR